MHRLAKVDFPGQAALQDTFTERLIYYCLFIKRWALAASQSIVFPASKYREGPWAVDICDPNTIHSGNAIIIFSLVAGIFLYVTITRDWKDTSGYARYSFFLSWHIPLTSDIAFMKQNWRKSSCLCLVIFFPLRSHINLGCLPLKA